MYMGDFTKLQFKIVSQEAKSSVQVWSFHAVNKAVLEWQVEAPSHLFYLWNDLTVDSFYNHNLIKIL